MMATSLDHRGKGRLIASDDQLSAAIMELRDSLLTMLRRLYRDPILAEESLSRATERLFIEHRKRPLCFCGLLPLRYWLLRATQNASRAELRRRQKLRLGTDAPIGVESERSAPDYLFQALLPYPDESVALHDVANVLNQLSPKDQASLAWYLSISDNEPLTGTQRSRLRRLRQTLRPMLERAGVVDASHFEASAEVARFKAHAAPKKTWARFGRVSPYTTVTPMSVSQRLDRRWAVMMGVSLLRTESNRGVGCSGCAKHL